MSEAVITTEADRLRALRSLGVTVETTWPGDCDSGECGHCRRCYEGYVQDKMNGELDD